MTQEPRDPAEHDPAKREDATFAVDAPHGAHSAEGALAARALDEGGEIVLQLAEERAHIHKRERLIGRVRVSTVTREEDVELIETLRESRVEIERVAKDVFIDAVPEVREEGDVTVIPVVEEVIVRQLVLREEIHVRRIDEEREVRETVRLRTQEAVIERDPEGTPPSAG